MHECVRSDFPFETLNAPICRSERELNDFFLDWDGGVGGNIAGSGDSLGAAASAVRDCGLAVGLIQRVREGGGLMFENTFA